MNPNEYIIKLVTDALSQLETQRVPLSTVIRKCIRIGRLRNDLVNQWWLEWELVDITKERERLSVLSDIAPHLTQEAYTHFRKRFADDWLQERDFARVNEDLEVERGDNVLPRGVGEIELFQAHYADVAQDVLVPDGLHPLDLYFVQKEKASTRFIARTLSSECGAILERIRNRVHEFLSQTEKQLVYGQLHSDLFERNRQYVDLKLGQLCPDALDKFMSAYKRLSEGDPEARSQALASCRRLLKSLADVLYPPRDEPVAGPDGKTRILGEEQYVSRLWQYVYGRVSSTRSGQLLLAEVQETGNRLDRLYDLTSKGVHSETSEFEVNQAVIQTYLLIGDLMRLYDETSAIGMENQETA